jgi:hypothetical protein
MTIICTCGHEVEDFKDTQNLVLADFNDVGEKCLSSVVYCNECANNAIEEGYVLNGKKEEDAWLTSPLNGKCRYSTNWMGPAGLWWYQERGLTKMVTHVCESEEIRDMLRKRYPEIEVGDGYEIEEVAEHYSCGRIDVRGGNTDIYYGDEIGVPPMQSEDWGRFGYWLDTVETDFMWTLDELVEMYERSNPKIRWAKDEKDD